MHIETGAILSIVAVVTLLITAAGVVGMGFRVGNNTQTLQNYRETAQSWKDKADAQAIQITLLEKASTEKDHQIAELQAKVSLLEKLVLGESTAASLREDHQHLAASIAESRELYVDIRDSLQEASQGIGEILERVRDDHRRKPPSTAAR